jgi:hypothetical protein
VYQATTKVKKEALKTVKEILDRIISRPDDINARRLRVTHAILKVQRTRCQVSHPPNHTRINALLSLVQEKLTGKIGGMELLCAIGFEPRLQDLTSTVSAENRAAMQARILTMREDIRKAQNRPFISWDGESISIISTTGSTSTSSEHVPFKYGVDVFPFLAPNTLWDLHLEMQEPAIEALTEVGAAGGAAVKLSWLDWFDGLNANKIAIEAAIGSL